MREKKCKKIMSTKSKKLYFRSDLKEAERKNEKVRKYFSRKYKSRKTVQIRVSEENHKKLKVLANKEALVLSFLLDIICEHFFKFYKD